MIRHFDDQPALYHGLRMTADEYFQLGETEGFYELIDGMVVMSPSPTPRHQMVAARLLTQIGVFLENHPVGEVFFEVDVHLQRAPRGGDLVYRPDIVFVRSERVARNLDRIAEPPDLIVEIASESSRRYDQETKKADYERFGVLEFWLIDPEEDAMTFYRLRKGRYVETVPEGDFLSSEAIPGFVLDVARMRRAFLLG
jgi:Uma2 family endonuclease